MELVTPTLPVPSPDEKRGEGTLTTTWHHTFRYTENNTGATRNIRESNFGFNRYALTRPRRVSHHVYKRFCHFFLIEKKRMASVLQDAVGVFFIDYLEIGRKITEAYYSA